MTSEDNEDELKLKLASLHKHWISADSINYHVRRSIKAGPGRKEETGFPEDVASLAFQASLFQAMCVWYALLQVVVEGYRALKCADERIDALLVQSECADLLRRFRNATFHYQEDPISQKHVDFIVAPDSEKWVRNLNKEFKRFFEERCQVAEWVSALQRGSRGAGGGNHEK